MVLPLAGLQETIVIGNIGGNITIMGVDADAAIIIISAGTGT